MNFAQTLCKSLYLPAVDFGGIYLRPGSEVNNWGKLGRFVGVSTRECNLYDD